MSPMKRIVLLLTLVCPLVANAGNDFQSMLAEGKTWFYTYRHFDESKNAYDPTTYRVTYTVKGDTMIDNRLYKKIYRYDQKARVESYHGAFREDEHRRVWQYDYEGNQEDFMICDFFCTNYPGAKVGAIGDAVNLRGIVLHRYRWNGVYQMDEEEEPIIGSTTGVEGVGLIDKGLIHYLYEPGPGSSCDYEQFDYVKLNGLIFTNNDFNGPSYIQLTEDEKQFLDNNNNFAFQLFRKVRSEESILLSPLSITYTLGMLNNGAAGQTQQEIYTMLGFDDVDAQNAFCQKMINALLKAGYADRTTNATISNTIFVNQGQGWQLQYDFSHTVNSYYYAYPSARDFHDGETRQAINEWAKSRSNGMIDEILSEDEFDPDAVSYLLNAVYFKGTWSDPFDANNTKEEAFAGNSTVPMMHKEDEEMTYAENDLYQTISMPYGNGTYAMQVFLPREGKTLDEVVESLNGQNWQIGSNSNYEVDLKLPRFETSTNQDLIEVMKELGMISAFSPETADFSNLCTDNNGKNLYIELMKQVAKIKVNEQGTEAAAITIDGWGGSGMPRKATFHANRPFLYLISEQSTGIILFMGQYMGPGLASPVVSALRGTAEAAVYDISGRQIAKPQHGVNIIRMSDGTTRKVLIK